MKITNKAPEKPARFWNLAPDTEAPGDGVLDIDGPIADDVFWGNECSAKAFRQALDGLANVTVHINSPGGDVIAGAEIYSALREHSLNGKGRVKVIITALAASAASVVAMAGDEILISPVAYMMIHNPWTMACGDAKEMRKTAKTLDEIAEGLITAYQHRTGKSRDSLKKMLESETWMSASRCVEEGFADAIYGVELQAADCLSTEMTRATPENIREMCRRWEQLHGEADPEKDPEEEDPDREGADPDEKDPDEETEEKPKEEPDGDPEEPEKDPEEDPDRQDTRGKRAEIVRRAQAVAEAAAILAGGA